MGMGPAPGPTFSDVPIEDVRAYWDRRPCNIRHSPQQPGTREYFNEVEARKYFVEPHIPRFAEFERWSGAKVLEIGCGIGTDTLNFARAGAHVTAVDLSPVSLQLAEQRARVFGLEERIQFYCADVEDLSSTVPVERYDLIYAFGVIHHTPNPDRALTELDRYLSPDTTLKLMVYNRRSWKSIWIVLIKGRGRFWEASELLARHSEAQVGSPVTYTYSRREIESLVRRHGFRISNIWVDHIFPYRIADYVAYRYVKQWYFRWMPAWLFRMLERWLGWHICLTAQYGGDDAAPSRSREERMA